MVQTKRSQRCVPVTSRARCSLAVSSRRLSATGACTSAKWRPTLSCGDQCEGRHTASHGMRAVAPSMTAKSSTNARLSSAAVRQGAGRAARQRPMAASPSPRISWPCSDQPSARASMRASPSQRKACACSAAACSHRAAQRWRGVELRHGHQGLLGVRLQHCQLLSQRTISRLMGRQLRGTRRQRAQPGLHAKRRGDGGEVERHGPG